MNKLLNPQQIYESYKNGKIGKFETAKKLIMIIESGNHNSHIESSIKLLEELIINNNDPFFLFLLYDSIGWSIDPIFKSVKKEVLTKIDSYVQLYVKDGVIYEEAILLAFFEHSGEFPEKLVKINFNENVNDIYMGGQMHYKVSEDGHVIGIYFAPHGDPWYIPFIPESIYRLEYLEELVLLGCELKTIPETIGRLKSLKLLMLNYNLIANLPQSIGDLDTLEELNLTGNYIEALPESIGLLMSLKKLELSENSIKVIPENIGSLSYLEELNLAVNKIQTLPESIGSLKSLKKLNVYENDIKFIPDPIVPYLKNLKQFSCDHTILKRLELMGDD